MKTNKLPLIISIIALVGVILLLIDKVAKKTPSSKNDETTQTTGELNIAVYYLDTVVSKYDLYNQLSLELAQKQQDLEKELQSKMMSLQNRAYQLQTQYSQHLITSQKYQEQADKLTNEQMQLQQWQETKSYELNENQMQLTERVYDSIMSVVNTINVDKKYNLIFGTPYGATISYADPSWDISPLVIKMLNEKYSNFSDTTKTK
jgi:Skp family chaperone for outer membrane proteins